MSKNGDNRDPSESLDAEALRRGRAVAAHVMLVSAIFAGVVLGVMIATHFAEPPNAPFSPTLEALREELHRNPDDERYTASLRELDRELRRRYLERRRRLRIGAALLLIGAAVMAAAGRCHAALDPRKPRPSTPAERRDADLWLARRRRNLIAVGLAGGATLAVLLVMALTGGADYPRTPAPSPDSPGQTGGALVPPSPQPAASRRYRRNWPQFRGPTGMGIVPEGKWPTEWDAGSGRNIVWKTEVPAPGNSSPVVWAYCVFLTGATAAKQEVLCFDRATGREVWRAAVRAGRPPGHEVNVMDETGHAAPTPATDGFRVYATYASADVAAVDFSGKVVWARNLGKPESAYGRATSLLVYRDMVLVQFDRGSSADENRSALIALDAKTGKTIWRAPRPVPNSWSSPLLIETDAGAELITAGDPYVISYDPDTGVELWRCEGLSGDVAPMPVHAAGLIFVTNEYAQVMAIRTGGAGDVTKTHIAWTAEEGMSDASSPIATEKYFLQAHSSGLLTCYAAGAGKLLWEHRLQASVWASPTLAGGIVYLPGEDGKVYLFGLADKFELIRACDLGEPLYATPAFADGFIYARGKKHLFCIGGSEGAPANE